MKKSILIVSALLISAACFAQEWQTQTITVKNGKGNYNSYLTNDWNDNLYFGVAGGIATRFTIGGKSDIKKSFVDPNLNIYVLKWFTPCVGARFGYMGVTGREGLDSYSPYQINHSPLPFMPDGGTEYVKGSATPGTLHYGSFMLHGDLLWNITNTVHGFKRGRFYTISAYFSGGYLKIYDNKTVKGGLFSPNYDREFTLGIGLYNTFRITDRIIATADLRLDNHASRYRSNTGVRTNVARVSVGVAYNIFKTTWNDVTEVNATINEALESAKVAEEIMEETRKTNENLNAEVQKLNQELVTFKDNKIIKVDAISYAEMKARAEKAELVMYFYINESTLNFSELYHLDTYVKNCLEKNPDFVFNITGSADKGTGNDKSNEKLASDRANRVKDILMKEYGVKEENITVNSVVTDKHADGGFDRCVLIEK